MNPFLSAALDAGLFVGLSWAVWRLLGRAIPIAVLPIVIGLALAASGVLPAHWGVPSMPGQTLGWLGMLLLAFTAGLETRQSAHIPSATDVPPAGPAQTWRFVASAALALLLPFAAGTLAAKLWFIDLPGWMPGQGGGWRSAAAIGLCLAVSALPVLIGIVRELGPAFRPLTRVALRLAVLDDAALWVGLALLLIAAGGKPFAVSIAGPAAALAIIVLLPLIGAAVQRSRWRAPDGLMIPALLAFLSAGAWASSQLGLHALLGAYFAGVTVPARWNQRLPVERIGLLALIVLAPLFFGHSGLGIDGDALGWASLQASLLLLALSVAAKLAALLLYRPAAWLSTRQTLAVGMLLQCKGLMEIVAATILRDHGLISEHAFAALVTLAVLSTLITGPAFRWVVRPRTPPRSCRPRETSSARLRHPPEH